VVVGFVDTGGIVDHYCLNILILWILIIWDQNMRSLFLFTIYHVWSYH